MRFIVHELTGITISYPRAARKTTFYVMDSAYNYRVVWDSDSIAHYRWSVGRRRGRAERVAAEFERKYGS